MKTNVLTQDLTSMCSIVELEPDALVEPLLGAAAQPLCTIQI